MRNLLVATIAILLLLPGCKAIREAREDRKEQKAKDWLELHEEAWAKLCAEKFPVKSDSTNTTEYQPADNHDHTRQIDSLTKLIAVIDSNWFSILDSATTETAEAYVERIRELQGVIMQLRAVITNLQVAYKPCKPDTVKTKTRVTAPDSAAHSALRLEALRLQKELVVMTNNRDEERREKLEWKGKSKQNFWLAVASWALNLGLLIGIIVVLRINARIKKLTKPIDKILSPK